MKEKETRKSLKPMVLLNFSNLIQTIQEGYELDFMTNEGFPQQMGRTTEEPYFYKRSKSSTKLLPEGKS